MVIAVTSESARPVVSCSCAPTAGSKHLRGAATLMVVTDLERLDASALAGKPSESLTDVASTLSASSNRSDIEKDEPLVRRALPVETRRARLRSAELVRRTLTRRPGRSVGGDAMHQKLFASEGRGTEGRKTISFLRSPWKGT